MLNIQGLGRNSVIATSVADGDRGTKQTIGYARQLVAEGLLNPDVRELAVAYCRSYGVPSHDELGEMNAVFQGVLRDFQFRKDTVGAELLQPAAGILRTHAGDCDDLNLILIPSLLGSIGYPTRAVTVKSDSERPGEYSHVYSEAQLSSGQWVPLDVARSEPAFGKSPEVYWQRQDWPLTPGASANAYLNGYGRPAVKRRFGMGAVLLRKKSVFPRRGMGDISDIASAIAQDAGAILPGVAQVIKASNTPGVPYSGVGFPAPQQYTTGMQSPGVAVSASSPLLIGGILIVAALFAFSRR